MKFFSKHLRKYCPSCGNVTQLHPVKHKGLDLVEVLVLVGLIAVVSSLATLLLSSPTAKPSSHTQPGLAKAKH